MKRRTVFRTVLAAVCVAGIGCSGEPEKSEGKNGNLQSKSKKMSKPDLSKIYGKIQFVTSFPDFKVKVVNSFPDLKVKKVTSFPDSAGKWEMVTSFPDYKIQIVDSFPDFKIEYVTSFPGVK